EINNNDPTNNVNYGIAFVSLSDPEAAETTTGLNIGTYFGWNNLFTTGSQVSKDGSSQVGISQNLAVRRGVVNDHAYLSRATLSKVDPLPTKAIEVSDGTNATEMSQFFNQNILPNDTPNVPKRLQTILSFSSTIIAANAYKMDSVTLKYNSQDEIRAQMESQLGSQTAVNFTEEMTRMLQTQIWFNMSGQVVKNAAEMLEKLTSI
ncbi:MAG: hypothetical protein K2X98_02390, partial [Alphaproteobacteria bacterium]|nr:hypothetical protein [Alphaproteobacteria bacterium]MBX9977082.1 hypothetical protein [Alphaproteobacteria bacterium]